MGENFSTAFQKWMVGAYPGIATHYITGIITCSSLIPPTPLRLAPIVSSIHHLWHQNEGWPDTERQSGIILILIAANMRNYEPMGGSASGLYRDRSHPCRTFVLFPRRLRRFLTCPPSGSPWFLHRGVCRECPRGSGNDPWSPGCGFRRIHGGRGGSTQCLMTTGTRGQIVS